MATIQVEETLKNIQSHDGVEGIIIMNNEGLYIKSTMDNAMSVRYAGLVQQLIDTTKSMLKKGDPTDELKSLRLRTKKNEILIIHDKQYVMIVVQNPTGTKPPM